MEIYYNTLKQAKYIDLNVPLSVRPSRSGRALDMRSSFLPSRVRPFPAKSRNSPTSRTASCASAYDLPTDQYGTQLDPPAHWDEYGATISDLPATFAVRPLVVIDVHEKVATDPKEPTQCPDDIKAWEAKHGRIPEGIPS